MSTDMWTKKAVKCVRPPESRKDGTMRGFTLIELMVVIAIIALLIAILLPSLSSARQHAKNVKCGAQLRGLGNAFALYSSHFNEWIPGMNTSGVGLEALKFNASGDPDLLRDPDLPVQPQDWLSPLLRFETTLPASRAKRFQLLTNFYHCPAQVAVESVLYPYTGSNYDLPDFRAEQHWTALSYLMPVHFQYWGQQEKNTAITSYTAMSRLILRAKTAPVDWEVVTKNYVSKVNFVGTPANKILVSDGTRYLTATNVLDHDVSPFPNLFGSFTDAGAWWSGSTAFGVREKSKNWDGDDVARGAPGNGKNLALSYRHYSTSAGDGSCKANKGTINALFFDGHVESLADRDSRKIDYWYPRGAVVENPAEGMTRVPDKYVIP